MSESKRQHMLWLQSLRVPDMAFGAQLADDTHLRGWWLIFARIAWWVLAAVTVAFLGAGSVARFAQIHTLCPTAACDDGRLSPAAMLTLRHLGISNATYLSLVDSLRILHLTFSMYLTTTLIWEIVSAAVFAGVAAIICWRNSADRMALFTSLTLLMFGATVSNVATRLPQESAIWILPVNIITFLGTLGFVTFFLIFPDGRFVPHWTRWVALAWIALTIPTVIVPGSTLDLNTWPPLFNLAAESCLLVVGIWAQIHRYGHVDTRAQRVQTKWVVFGAVAAIVTIIGLNWAALPLLPTAAPSLSVTIAFLAITSITRVAFLVIPVSIGIAIVRHQLFDIDLIIKWTLVYGALTIILAVLYEGSSTTIEYMLLNVTGQESLIAVVAVSFAVGLVVHPIQRAIQNIIDRMLFRPKYVVERHIDAFGERLRQEIDLDMAPEQLAQTLDDALGQAWVSVESHLSELHRVQHALPQDDKLVPRVTQ